ncbi:FecCD family ABC transporter permease [Rhizobium sp. SL42]|uniref:FecCD family ABC transporter permease n=1 Tax=Rhizobium sp. SL42 TaxID=2806346 RepID=UPI001F2BD475|nr:iron ABC transporter permease [Rhizobium sp. SL42]
MLRTHRRDRRFLCLTALVIAILAGLHLIQGPRSIPLHSYFATFQDPATRSFDQFVIVFLRLPRILAAIIAGAALGASGFLLQTAMRNRLGEPQILGLNAGASLAVVLSSSYPFLAPSPLLMPFTASLGAGALFGLILLLSTAGRDRFDPDKMIFYGIAISALANAIVSAVLILNEDTLDELRFWLVGDTAGVGYAALATTSLIILLGLLFGILLMPSLAAFALGETIASSLGATIRRTRIAALLVTALLSGSAVSLVGPIGFVGLIAPAFWPGLHSRPSTVALLLSALSGAALLLAADLLAVMLLAPVELPTGALTGLAGAPVFIWLVARKLP